MNKKSISLLLATSLMGSIVINANNFKIVQAEELNSINQNSLIDSKLTEENVLDLINKYNLEYEIVGNENDLETDNVVSLDDLENKIIEAKKEPAEIDLTAPNSENTTYYNELSPRSMASPRAITTLTNVQEISSGLKIKYSISGNWYSKGRDKFWSSATSSSITQASSNGFKKLGNVRKRTAQVTHYGKTITLSYEYVIDHYITVPIPGVSNVIKIHSHSQIVRGKQYFHASRI